MWDASQAARAETVIATAETPEVDPEVVGDWDELERYTAPGPPRTHAGRLPRHRRPSRAWASPSAEDFGGETGESLRLPLCLAGANILIWLLARLSGVVELIGVSFCRLGRACCSRPTSCASGSATAAR